MANAQNLKIEHLKNGSVLDMINRELQLVANDIADVNKKTDSKRSVSVKLTFAPTPDGQYGKLDVSVTSVLGQQNVLETSVFFGYDAENKQGIASEYVIPQLPLNQFELGDEEQSN